MRLVCMCVCACANALNWLISFDGHSIRCDCTPIVANWCRTGDSHPRDHKSIGVTHRFDDADGWNAVDNDDDDTSIMRCRCGVRGDDVRLYSYILYMRIAMMIITEYRMDMQIMVCHLFIFVKIFCFKKLLQNIMYIKSFL